MSLENLKIRSWDERRNLLIPGDEVATLDVCIRHFISTCREAISTHGSFRVALSGGSTPKANLPDEGVNVETGQPCAHQDVPADGGAASHMGQR